MSVSKRAAHVSRDGEQLNACVTINWGEQNHMLDTVSTTITADATKAGWDALHTELREWYSPITVECGQ